MASHQSMAHVFATDQGVNLQNETIQAMFYDDATQILMVVKGNVVFGYDLAMESPGDHDQLVMMYPLQEGPRVMAIRCSLDRKLLAIQRSPVLLELVDLATGNISVHGSKKGKHDILGFFFSELPDAEFVLVTRGGLELCQPAAKRPDLRCRDRLKLLIAWCLYTHETRCLLVGTGHMAAPYIQAWQFVSSGLITLPPFVVGMSAAAAAALISAAGAAGPLAAPPALAPATFAAAATSFTGPATSAPAATTPQHLRLLKMYGRVYCAYINVRASRLELYRFYTDTVIMQHAFELVSTHIELSVVDNVLVVHHIDLAVAMLLDVCADVAQPVASPLPLVLLPACMPEREGINGAASKPAAKPPQLPQPPPAAGSSSAKTSGEGTAQTSTSVVMERWQFYAPNIILDPKEQIVYKLQLEVRAIMESCSDLALLAGFLQRRRTAGAGAGSKTSAASSSTSGTNSSPKQLLLAVIKSALQEHLPMPVLRRMFDNLSLAWSKVVATAAAAGPANQAAAAAVISPSELAQVFAWLHDEEVVDAPYLQAAVSEYFAAANAAGVQLLPQLQQMAVDLQLQQSQADQVAQAMYCTAGGCSLGSAAAITACLEATANSSTAVAAAALLHAQAAAADFGLATAWAAAGSAPAAAQAGASAGAAPAQQGRGGAAERYVRSLLAQGRVVQAARVAKDGQVVSVLPKELLQAAATTGDLGTFAAVYRCFKDALMPSYPRFEVARKKLMPEAVSVGSN